jgi:hypothetical protein
VVGREARRERVKPSRSFGGVARVAIAAFAFALLVQCTIAFGDETFIPFHVAATDDQARGRLRKVAGQETFVVTFAQRPYHPKKDHAIPRRWGWDPRIEMLVFGPEAKNYLLTKWTLTLNGKPLIIPPEHLSGLFNPKFSRLGILRDREKHTLTLSLDCGNAPWDHFLDFYFADGKYIKRIISYSERSEGAYDKSVEELSPAR